MAIPAENNISPNSKGKPAGSQRESAAKAGESQIKSKVETKPQAWNQLSITDKSHKVLDTSFNFFILPLCGVSFLSSLGSFVSANFLDGENEFIDKVAEFTNKGAYFFNGAYGALRNALGNNIIGALGYSFVSFSSIVGDNENMYQWKGPGSALDQLPGLNNIIGGNEKIKKKYSGERFNEYKTFSESVCKTWDSIKVVSSDIYDEYKSNLKEGKNILKATNEIFVISDKKTEKHLVISTLGILAGFVTGIGLGFKNLGAGIRDTFGILADIGVLGIAFAPLEEGDSISSRIKYGFAGGGYLGGGFADLILYRIFGIAKADILTVGLDNSGFGSMTWADTDSIERSLEIAKQKDAQSKELQTQMSV